MHPRPATEAAPVGWHRVGDPAGQEGRELQANVFARESLLPRLEARRLHLTDRLGAALIADLRALPRDLIRQQLLDALLLPPAAPAVPASAGGPLRPDPPQSTAAAQRWRALHIQRGRRPPKNT